MHHQSVTVGTALKKCEMIKFNICLKKSIYSILKEYNEDFTLGKLQVSLFKLKRSY